MIEIAAILVSIGFIAFASMKFGWHPFYLLIGTSIALGFILFSNPKEVMPAIGDGFGGMLSRIAFIIIFGALLGNLLYSSGAMDRIAHAIFSGWLKKFPVLAMGLAGLVVGVPVFCDAGYVVLSHIPRAMPCSKNQKIAMALMLGAGLYLSHTLIPPTPGPMAALGALNLVNFTGTFILAGSAVSLFTLFMLYAWISIRFRSEPSQDHRASPVVPAMSLLRALFPLLLPLLLIGAGSIVSQVPGFDFTLLLVVSQPAIALALACAAAAILHHRALLELYTSVGQTTLAQVGPILLLTGAGGALGNVIAKSDFILRLQVESDFAGAGFTLIFAGFVIAALVKTMQGSSTGAIVITAAILGSAANAAADPVNGIFLVLAIGAGALGVSHTNDSYFWVIAKFENWTPGQSLKYWSASSAILSISAFLMVTLAYFVNQ